jgi:hypothetical protein
MRPRLPANQGAMRIPQTAATLALTLPLLLAGCGEDVSRTFGLQRDAPDEFQVTTRAPLSMPPDFALRAPRPGAPRPQEQSGPDSAQAVLAPQAALAAGGAREPGVSPGVSALLQAAGPQVQGDIRAKVDSESHLDRSPPALVDRLMFWRTPPSEGGLQVDPRREAQRLRENAALGQNVAEGDSRIIQPRSRGLFDRIFR